MDIYEDIINSKYYDKLAKRQSSLLYDLFERRLCKRTSNKKNKIETKSILKERKDKYY